MARNYESKDGSWQVQASVNLRRGVFQQAQTCLPRLLYSFETYLPLATPSPANFAIPLDGRQTLFKLRRRSDLQKLTLFSTDHAISASVRLLHANETHAIDASGESWVTRRSQIVSYDEEESREAGSPSWS